MEKKQRTKYIIADTLSAMLAWGILFLFRKVAFEHTGFSDVADVFNDSNFWFGLILVPAGWLSLYTIQGAYRNVLRRARLTELLDTLLASLIGVVAIFFLLLVDDHISTYRNYYTSFLFLFGVHFTLTYIPRLIITSHTVRAVHTRQLGFPTVMIQETLLAINSCGDIIIKITPDARDISVGAIHQHSIFHAPFIVINNRLMPEWQYSLKRIFDIVISLVAMILLSPVYVVTAIIVKATSPGPVFYAQERIGHLGRPFKMHKFRSMYVDAEQAGPALSKDNDPRITPFGRFMRKVRLDEIPQFYNVLRGTMSLVGPRPERQFYIDQIVKRAPEYLLLQRVKPGITSWGQVRYGYASNVDEMVERLRYDLLYLDNMSLTTDLKILLYTVIIIIQGRGK